MIPPQIEQNVGFTKTVGTSLCAQSGAGEAGDGPLLLAMLELRRLGGGKKAGLAATTVNKSKFQEESPLTFAERAR
jgi:hypothetical protein